MAFWRTRCGSELLVVEGALQIVERDEDGTGTGSRAGLGRGGREGGKEKYRTRRRSGAWPVGAQKRQGMDGRLRALDVEVLLTLRPAVRGTDDGVPRPSDAAALLSEPGLERSPSPALRMSWSGTRGEPGLPGLPSAAPSAGELTRTVIDRGVENDGVGGAPETLRARRGTLPPCSGVAGASSCEPGVACRVTAGLPAIGARAGAPGVLDGVLGPPPAIQRSPGWAGLSMLVGEAAGIISLKWSRRNLGGRDRGQNVTPEPRARERAGLTC